MAAINYKITELTVSSNLYRTDLLMISKNISENVYSSYKISLEVLMKLFDGKFERNKSVEIGKKWKINSGGLFIDDKNITGKTSAINLNYAYNTFMDKFLKLKTLIYDTPCIPSCIGEIIFSTSLNTLEKVQKKYGNHTNWEQIQGRFIMSGSNSSSELKGEIGKLTGEVKVSLKLENIPPHSHRLMMNTNEKSIKLNETKEFQSTTVCVKGERKAEPTIEENSNTHHGRTAKTVAICSENREIQADAVIAVDRAHLDEPTREISLNTRGNISTNSGNNLEHNNIPPFYSVYIWRRKS